MSSTLRASVFMGKSYLENLHSIKNTVKDLTMKQMFDISEKLIAEQSDEIYGVNTINWEDSSWKHLSLVGGEQVISLSHAKVPEPTIKYCLGGQVELVHHNRELWTQLMVSQWNSSGISSQDSPHCSSATKSKSSCHRTDHLYVDVQRHLMGI